MSQIGTQISFTQVAAAPAAPYDTANAFMVGLSDWGPVNTPVTIQSLAGVIGAVGPRSGTNTTAYDSLDVFFREGASAPTAFFSRVTGPAASAASLTLRDASGSAALLVSAVYVGNYGNDIQVAVANAGGSFVVSLTDTYGNALSISPSLASRAAAATWAATNPYVNISAITNDAGALPATSAATVMAGGTDDRTHVTLTQWTTALNSFPATLGPGQLSAPGITNTVVSGIWSAIGTACTGVNRIGLCDTDDDQPASAIVADVGATYNSDAVGPLAFWAGNLTAPGVAPGTTRSIPPSAVISGVCSRVDATNNPNLAGAGSAFPMNYCTGSYSLVSGITETYSAADVSTLNNVGVNTFANRFGTFENFGFVSSVLSSQDAIFWQMNHYRLRMAIAAEAQILAEPFVFSQLDGGSADIIAFNQALTTMLSGFLASGALYGSAPGTPNAAFSVNTGPQVNTPQSLQAGQLNAILSVRMSPFAQLIDITINSVPITTSVPAGSTAAASSSSSGF